MTSITIICRFTIDSDRVKLHRCKLILFRTTPTAVFFVVAAFRLWNMFKRKRKNVAAQPEVGLDNNAGNLSMFSGLNSMYVFLYFCVKYVQNKVRFCL